MRPLLTLLILCLIPTISHALNKPAERLAAIDAELEQLARFTMRGGVGNVGWFSIQRDRATSREWAQIDLSEPATIDRIVLVPVLWNDAAKGPQADGFPDQFEVIAGTETNPEGAIIGRYNQTSKFLPRVAPMVIHIPPTTASWIRINVTRLSSHARNKKFRVKLSEIMLFSGERNIALHQSVTTSSTGSGWGAAAIYGEALVDGITPYLMDAASTEKSDPFMTFSEHNAAFSISIDLQQCYPVDGFIFHSYDVNEYMPQINPTDFGVPTSLTVLGANNPDFSDAVTLLNYERDSVYQVGNIMPYWTAKTPCRYIRVSVPKGERPLDIQKEKYCISFAEIEILADGKNVALGKRVTNPEGQVPRRAYMLTDGLNHFGEILSISEWMDQLARRHDLETERPLIAKQLDDYYEKQKETLIITRRLALSITLAFIITTLVLKLIRTRQLSRIKERFAADLHDELGANLHSIGLISDVAQDAQTPAEWKQLCQRIRDLTERTSTAVRHCTNMLGSEGLYTGLVADMQRAAERIATNLEHTIDFEGEPVIEHLKPQARIDLFLFYKECLVNICRHSGATRISTQLIGTKKEIRLIITDNGSGISTTPNSLKRRARLARAKLTTTKPETGGTQIILRLKTRPQKYPS